MARSLPSHFVRGQFPQFLVNQREQFVGGRLIAAGHGFQNAGDVAHGEDGSRISTGCNAVSAAEQTLASMAGLGMGQGIANGIVSDRWPQRLQFAPERGNAAHQAREQVLLKLPGPEVSRFKEALRDWRPRAVFVCLRSFPCKVHSEGWRRTWDIHIHRWSIRDLGWWSRDTQH